MCGHACVRGRAGLAAQEEPRGPESHPGPHSHPVQDSALLSPGLHVGPTVPSQGAMLKTRLLVHKPWGHSPPPSSGRLQPSVLERSPSGPLYAARLCSDAVSLGPS